VPNSPVLCYAVLCCAVLCCAVLCCAVLCCAVLCCAVLCWSVFRPVWMMEQGSCSRASQAEHISPCNSTCYLQIRGALRGASTPVNVPHLLKRIQLDGLTTGSNIASNIIEDLVSEGAIRGILRGGGSSWIPTIYAKSQQESVRRFYEQNSYIGYIVPLIFA